MNKFDYYMMFFAFFGIVAMSILAHETVHYFEFGTPQRMCIEFQGGSTAFTEGLNPRTMSEIPAMIVQAISMLFMSIPFAVWFVKREEDGNNKN